MRKLAVVLAVLAVLVAVGWAAKSGAARVGKDVTIPGALSCAACKLAGSPEHKCGKECCHGCIKGGDSLLLEDEQGNLYLLISRDKERPVISAERMDLIGEKVTVKGIMVEKGGLKGIYVESIGKSERNAPTEKKEEHTEH